MTRLTVKDLNQAPKDLNAYDLELKAITGMSLLELALKTIDMTVERYKSKLASMTWVAIIPTSTGDGILPGFSEKVTEIGCYLGLPCRVTKTQDVAGLEEAVAGGSEMIVIADDSTFLALNLISRRVVNNSTATGEIYAVALAGASKGVADRYVGVLGLGPVGQAAATRLCLQGGHIIVHDKNRKKQTSFLSQRADMRGASSVEEVIGLTDMVLDATNGSNIIKTKELKTCLLLAAPGIPLGIDDRNSHMVRLIHDPLQLGVAAMIVQALA
jgi:pyrrolysine biosynthesis protein PylD